MQNIEQEDFSDVETMLEALRPVAPSERFFAAVANALDAPENTQRFPAARGHALRFPLRRTATSAALLIGAVGLGVWGYSSLAEKSDGNAVVAGTCDENSVCDFHLVNMERRVNSVTPVGFVAGEDGSVSRRVRYSYTDESWWKDDEKGVAFVELRPHEEIVSMELAVY